MKIAALQEKFDRYRKLIQSNIDTIRALMNQSKELTELTNHVSDDEKKKKLIQIRENIDGNIDDLLDNTKELFNEYEALIKAYAGSK